MRTRRNEVKKSPTVMVGNFRFIVEDVGSESLLDYFQQVKLRLPY